MVDTLLLILAAMAPFAVQAARREPTNELDRLFEQLRSARQAASARAITDRIWACWMRHDDPHIQALLDQGVDALMKQRYEEALTAFDEVIRQDPDFAEGWNKRATARYLTGDFAGSVRDIQRTLALEPRHFGAHAGLGAIYLLIANHRGALDAFEAVLALNPHLDGIKKQVEALHKALGGGKGTREN